MRPIGILLICGPLLLAGCNSRECSRKVSCPPYEPGVLESWLPQGAGDVLRYQNSNGATRSFTLRLYAETVPYETANGVDCHADRQLASEETTGPGNPAFAVILSQDRSGNEGLGVQQLDIIVDVARFTAHNVRDTGYERAGINYGGISPIRYTTLTLGGRTFQEVRCAMRDTVLNKEPGFQRVYLAKNRGLVAFSMYPNDSLWVLQ